jgi:hypothetical protein
VIVVATCKETVLWELETALSLVAHERIVIVSRGNIDAAAWDATRDLLRAAGIEAPDDAGPARCIVVTSERAVLYRGETAIYEARAAMKRILAGR